MDYFLRFLEADKPAVRALGILLGELHDTDDGSLVGNGFVYIGHLTEPTGETIVDEQGMEIAPQRIICNTAGEPYIHANLRTSQNLKAVAESLAAQDPALSDALANLGRFFLLDDEGAPRAPKSPRVVFA